MQNDGPIGSVEVMTFRCVVVDDNPAFVAAARALLEREGVTVLGCTGSGAEAVRLVAELRPDLVLVDIDLGAESGLELARRLAGPAGAAVPPVILISTYDEEDYADLIADSPAVGFLPKEALSAAAIRRLLAGRPDGSAGPLDEAPGR
jgi:DNA-binding NarL/FixJ family response regulator